MGIGRVDVKDAQFVTRGTVTLVDFLLERSWWMRRREWMRKGEEDVVLRDSTVTGSTTCLFLWWRCFCCRHTCA